MVQDEFVDIFGLVVFSIVFLLAIWALFRCFLGGLFFGFDFYFLKISFMV